MGILDEMVHHLLGDGPLRPRADLPAPPGVHTNLIPFGIITDLDSKEALSAYRKRMAIRGTSPLSFPPLRLPLSQLMPKARP